MIEQQDKKKILKLASDLDNDLEFDGFLSKKLVSLIKKKSLKGLL